MSFFYPSLTVYGGPCALKLKRAMSFKFVARVETYDNRVISVYSGIPYPKRRFCQQSQQVMNMHTKKTKICSEFQDVHNIQEMSICQHRGEAVLRKHLRRKLRTFEET